MLLYWLIELSDQFSTLLSHEILTREEALETTIRNLEKHHRNVKSVPSTKLHNYVRCSGLFLLHLLVHICPSRLYTGPATSRAPIALFVYMI